jgi:uncharacterized membrane protein required for colicin V production
VTTIVTILGAALIVAVVLPLLLMLLFVIADALGLSFADRILGVAVHALIVEFAIGSVVNVLGGLTIVALAIWGSWHFLDTMFWPLLLLLIPVGLWRVWKGVAIWMPAERTSPPPDQVPARRKR